MALLFFASEGCISGMGCRDAATADHHYAGVVREVDGGVPCSALVNDVGGGCSDRVRNDADLNISLHSDPPYPGPDSDLEVRFTVELQQLVDDFPGGYQWGYSLLGSGGKTTFTLGFESYKPWLLTNQVGRVWRLASSASLTACAAAQDESQARVERVVRDDDGTLELVHAMDVPLELTGKVDLVPGWTPEFSVEWVDGDCPSASGVQNVWSRPYQDVGIRLEPKGAAPFDVGVGGRQVFELGGVSYVVAVAAAARFLDSDCGESEFVVYRQGFLCGALPDGGTP